MSTTEEKSKSDTEDTPVIIKSNETIRQRVEDRHWQLFESRLKNQLPEMNKENYTHTNDYRVIDCLKKVDRPQSPIQPNRRWETFCTQVTDKSNETNRVMSIFQNVWVKNWNTQQTDETQKQCVTDENTFLHCLSSNEHDRKVISSIFHRTASSGNLPTDKKATKIQ